MIILKETAINKIKEDYDLSFKEIENPEKLKKLMGFYGKTYKGNEKKKFKKFLELRKQKEIKKVIEQIKAVEQAEIFNKDLVITIEWKKSYMWGSNPKAYTNFGFKSESIGGWGYCKLSTATAQALNSHLPLLKILYRKENERLKFNDLQNKKNKVFKTKKHKTKDRRDFIGYGSGYNSLPSFEGGVGVSSHQTIMENLGLKMECVTSTNNTDVYLIKRAENDR